jgi:glycyl-tRNA synthetase
MTPTLDTIVSFAKRKGFVFQGSELYGGLAGTFDYGPHGLALRENIKKLWWKMFVSERDDMLGIDASLIMPARVWEASGHTETFADPLVADSKTGDVYRLDHVLEEAGIDPVGMSLTDMGRALKESNLKTSKGNEYGEPTRFNQLFPVQMGASESTSALAYLRGETAQGIFVNFKNILDTHHPKIPFGIAQIGKAFRNEIAPREFIFRLRELEQMEVEYFIRKEDWEGAFSLWQNTMSAFARAIGLPEENLHEKEIGDADRAHYSRRTIDFEFDFPSGTKELWGLAYRTDYDLSRHSEYSGVALEYIEEDGSRFIPHVIEPSLGVDRTMLAVLVSAYDEDSIGGDERVVLRLPASLAPIKAMVSPLLKNKPELVEKAREVYRTLKKEFGAIAWDDNGNIGKRYRRQDEIGTPWSVTIDFDTLEDDTVTLRDRDSGEQTRVPIDDLAARIRASIDL